MWCGALKIWQISGNILENSEIETIHQVCLVFKHCCLCLYTLTSNFSLDIDHYQRGYETWSKAVPLQEKKSIREGGRGEERGKEGGGLNFSAPIFQHPSSQRIVSDNQKLRHSSAFSAQKKEPEHLEMSMRVKLFQNRLKIMFIFYYEKKKYIGTPFLNFTIHLLVKVCSNSHSHNAFWNHLQLMTAYNSAQWYTFIFYLSPASRFQP